VTARPRLLLAITVYNGREFVPRCIESATRLLQQSVDVDVLVLDDCSPEPGFSDLIRDLCRDLGVQYYRTPRNLGITRNVNLALQRALSADYAGVFISNSDVIYPTAFAEHLWAVAQSDPSIGSVTAWSNNVSAYSLPNDDPDTHLASQGTVEQIDTLLRERFGTAAVDIPAGISFALLITRQALADVGLMDPVFGRGYCEETDWSRRSLQAGYRLVLAPGVFVYHSGRGSTLAAGMVSGHHTSVPANEALINYRYPTFHTEVGEFVNHSGVLPDLWASAARAIVRGLARAHGYCLDISVFERDPLTPGAASVRAWVDEITGEVEVEGITKGFRSRQRVSAAPSFAAHLTEEFGALPQAVRVFQQGALAEQLTRAATGPYTKVEDLRCYPERV
jgi:GT2 family glycosyltransferase